MRLLDGHYVNMINNLREQGDAYEVERVEREYESYKNDSERIDSEIMLSC